MNSKMLTQKLFIGIAALALLFVSQSFVIFAQTIGSCDYYPADPVNNLPAGYYQFNGGDAGDPNAWSGCTPGSSGSGGPQGPQGPQGPTPEPTQPPVPTQPSAPACNPSDRPYPQCGGSCQNVTYANTTKLWVVEHTDANCHKSWICSVVENNSGECGYVPPQPPAPIQPSGPTPINNCTVPVSESTCIDGQIWFCKKAGPECHGGNCMVDTGSRCYTQSQRTQPQQQQATPTPTQAPQPTVTPVPTLSPQQPTPAPPVPTPQIVQCPPGTVGQITGSTIICLGPSLAGPVVQTAVNVCPQGTTAKTINNQLVCEINEPRVVTVAGAKTEALPKTGLPTLAWVAALFLPLGFGLKRFDRGIKANWSNPNYLWEERKFKA